MTQISEDTPASKTKSTLLFAVLLLFFFQLLTVWIESIYRLALAKIEIGKEVYGILFLLTPLVLFLVPAKYERRFLRGVLCAFLLARAICPWLGAPALIGVGGLGVGAFLMLLCYAVSQRYQWIQGDFGSAAGLAILSSVALRSWRSSLDISMEGWTGILGVALALLALYLFNKEMRHNAAASFSGKQNSFGKRTIAMIGLFANFTLIYLVLSSPGVVNAWCGGGSFSYGIAVVITALAFTAALFGLGRRPPRSVLFGINALFLALLVGGILAERYNLPMTSLEGPVVVHGDAAPGLPLLLLALMCSPIILFNVRRTVCFAGCLRPRQAILPVLIGMSSLTGMTVLLICTNVWGYVPFGTLFRNRFYLPFLLGGLGMFVPLLLRGKLVLTAGAPNRRLGLCAAGIAFLALAGLGWCAASPPAPKADEKRLTVLTYNMQQGSEDNGDRAYLKQLALLRTINADIIGLQECDTARPSGGNVDTIRYFADALGYFAYYGPNTVSGTFGAAILSRYPIRNPYAFFTYSDSDEVGTAAAEIQVEGNTLLFFSNHPSGEAEVKNAHVDALIAQVGTREKVIATGDFNFRPHSSYFQKIAAVLTPSAAALCEERVDNHGKPSRLAREIDHIFISPEFRVLESHYLSPPASCTDHPAHWSVLALTD